MSAPTNADVASFLLQAAGVTITASAAVTSMIAAAIREMSFRTGYNPFIVSTETSKRISPQAVIPLPNGIFDVDSVVCGTTTWTADTEYELGPVDRAGTTGEPFEWIRLKTARWGSAPLVVTGKWGFASDYPAEFNQAIVELVAGRMLEAKRAGQLSSAVSWKEADASREYAGGNKLGSSDERDLLGGALITQALRQIDTYKRVVGWR